jgi:ribosomal protein S27AE
MPDRNRTPEQAQSSGTSELNKKEETGDYWRWCPQCGHELHNHKCKLMCPRCGYFMSCSDFD